VKLDEWNALDPGDAERELHQVCAAPRWAREVAAGRLRPEKVTEKTLG
jgi:hypothetical protein